MFLLDSAWSMHNGAGWWMLWGGLMMVLFWGAVIGLIVWGVSQFSGAGKRAEDTPLEIARLRYARGEITREEFEQFRRDLGG